MSGLLGGLARVHHQRLDWRSCVAGPDDQEGADLQKAGATRADVTVQLPTRFHPPALP
ncbi:hypothetical protein OG618_00780 [Kitasatospora sp. NBC_01246]|uniref:hypothetical protein n=1 Tax=Kitasatospora sp. NBC_01246 TaxID=2903570 RepID=UPI002E32E5DE|nr:hypothetical protein [Kitasatospora sp. NBC_01246]